MARRINDGFVKELQSGILKPVLEYVQKDDTLNLELRGNRITIYYRGGSLFSILQDIYKFEGMDNNYYQGVEPIQPSLSTINDYIPKAKHIIDIYITTKRNHLGEKDIQQQVARENNYSPNSLDTDYFILDTEYQDLGRFDIVALRWDSTPEARKLSQLFKPVITVFEVKQGYNTCGGKDGLFAHIKDMDSFLGSPNLDSFKKDMITVFKQKRELGLIKGIEKYKEITVVSEEIDFVFLLANYKSQSIQVKKELDLIKQDANVKIKPQFIYANSMGYGLFAKNIINGDEFITRFLCK